MKIQIEVVPHPKLNTELQFHLEDSQFEELGSFLSEVLSGNKSENILRLEREFKKGKGKPQTEVWNVFWKIREGSSRLMLAHPEEDTWVATIALAKEHLEQFMSDLEQKNDHDLSESHSLTSFCNLNLKVQKRDK